ncbi:DUF2017 domain-containing protein [Leifsonia sp. H3M29-4]|uniref:DUF2017 domain-containing protein n=1 Tax=Salinibacterium metalliresistens TaxID=3031321 RepID=UPI0023DA6953|nr:DUF2017 domain-containing protein [Salinibacterium metalliresistens]MDF1478576.1 DUF2017 domain-containing protein [Salinibacterium metalliresistens]
MIPFVRDGGGVTARLTADEAAALRNLSGQLVAMLLDRTTQQVQGDAAAMLYAQAGIGGGEHAPLDPALARLLPDAYLEDPDAASEHRHLTERGIVDRKIQNARRVAADLDSERSPVVVRLDEAAVQAWLRTLTDLRLTLAARLEIVEDGDEGRADDESDLAMLTIYDWLGYLQGSLVDCVSSSLDERDAADA